MILPAALALFQLLSVPAPPPAAANDAIATATVAAPNTNSNTQNTVENAAEKTADSSPAAASPATAEAPEAVETADAGVTTAPEAGVPAAAPAPVAGVTYVPGSLLLTPLPLAEMAPGAESTSRLAEPAAIILNPESDAAVAKRRAWEQKQKRIWWNLSVLQSGAATLDAASTRMVVSSGRGYETNPLLKPFAGNGSMYAAIQAGPLLLDYVGRRMITSRHEWLRRTWWVPQAVGTAVSFYCGANNLAVFASR